MSQKRTFPITALLAAFLWSACASTSVSGSAKVKSDTLAVFKDAEVDLTSNYPTANHGFNALLVLGRWPSSGVQPLFQFQDLAAAAANVSKARLLLNTCAWGTDWAAGVKTTLKARVFALKSDWVEGRGNWYWNNAAWHNKGNVFLANYTLPTLVRDSSLDPVGAPGVTNGFASLIDTANLIARDSQEISVTYPTASIWNLDTFPGPQDLVTLEVDVTDYVKSLKTSTDHGFLVAVEGTSNTKRIVFLSKEVQDGELGARLVLERRQNRGKNKMRHHLPQLGKPQSGESP